MKTLRASLFLIIYAIITFFWLLYDRRHVFDKHTVSEIIRLPAIWVFPILMLTVGLLLKALIGFVTRTRHNYFIHGQLACIAVTFLLFGYTYTSDMQHEKQFGNFDSNRANRANTFFESDTLTQIRAYDALESQFSDKNSFRITDLFSDNIDTVIENISYKIHVSWFEYYLSREPTKLLGAKYYVLADTVINAYINVDVNKNLDFRRRKAYKNRLQKIIDSLTD